VKCNALYLGKKDRYVLLSNLLARKFYEYLAACNPRVYLFEGQIPGEPMGERSVQYVINEALKRTDIKKQVSMHTLRHSYATHLLEDGVDILLFKESFIEKHQPHPYTLRVLSALEKCRTQALGGHVDGCDSCGFIRVSYNSCRNRHCPKCQTTNRESWILARIQDLLPVPYFHMVFTLPEQLNAYCLHYPKEFYTILFSASKEAMEKFAADPKHLGAQLGMISVLHTWGQNLSLHPHVHMIVPGGGITAAGNWKPAKGKGNFLFPVTALSIVYRGLFMEKLIPFLNEKNQPMDPSLRNLLYQKPWVVYGKPSFLGRNQVIEYLGRYSHKIAISNHRIQAIENGQITFKYKDYRKGGKQGSQGSMRLDAVAFLRRFCLHILPKGYRKIRHYGFLASRNKLKLRVQQFLQGQTPAKAEKPNWKQICKEKLNNDVEACPCCKTGKMIRILSFEANAPPLEYLIPQRQKEVSTKN